MSEVRAETRSGGTATALVGAANAIGRITGMVAEMVMSAVFGVGMATDAYYAAIRIPQLLRELLAEGSLQNAFVPAFSEANEKEGVDGAWRLASAFLGVLLMVLGGTVVIFWLGAPWLVRLMAEGFTDNAEKYALTIALTRWLSPFLVGLSLAGFVAAMLNVRGKFFWPAMAQNAFNLLIIAGALGSARFSAATGLPAIVAVAIATTLSGFVQLAVTAPALWREGFRFRPTLGGHPGLGRMLRYLGPAIIGISTVQFNLVVENQWASDYGDGPVTWLIKSFRLVQIPLAVFSGSVATTALAAVSRHVARGEDREVGDEVARALTLNTALVLPCGVAFFVLAQPLVALLFQRGAFTATDTLNTANMLQMYALAVLGICTQRLAVPLYYALGDPKTPMRLSIGAMLAKIPVILLLTHGFGLGVEALPLSHAITVSGECVFLAWFLRDRVAGRKMLREHVKIAVASAALGLTAWVTRDHLPVIAVCAVAAAVYLAIAIPSGALKLDFLRALRGNPGLPPSVDRETEEALRALAAGGMIVEDADGVGVVDPTGDRSWRLGASDGALIAVPSTPGGPGIGPATSVSAILRPGRPPRVVGLVVTTAGPERGWHADGNVLVEGATPGPRIPVGGAA